MAGGKVNVSVTVGGNPPGKNAMVACVPLGGGEVVVGVVVVAVCIAIVGKLGTSVTVGGREDFRPSFMNLTERFLMPSTVPPCSCPYFNNSPFNSSFFRRYFQPTLVETVLVLGAVLGTVTVLLTDEAVSSVSLDSLLDIT